MRFIHTADWQMGMNAQRAGPRARDLRNIRFSSAAEVVKAAKKHEVDFVLVAGDTFEHPDVDEIIVRRTVEIFNQFDPIPVLVLPGNHDPWNSGSIWRSRRWDANVGAHVKLCTEPVPVPVGSNTMVYPCPLTQKQSGLDPTEWIPAREQGDDQIRIGFAHGGLDILAKAPNFPISPERPESTGLDYLALGDWHGLLEHGRSVYSGTIEPTRFSERDPGHILFVDIPAAGESPKIESIQVAQLRWREFSLDIQDESDVREFELEIEKMAPVNAAVVRVSIADGSVLTDAAASKLAEIRAVLEEEAFHVDWPEEPETTHVDDLATHAFPGIYQNIYGDLAAIMDDEIPQGPGREFAGSDPSVVRSAISLLRKLSREVEE